MTSVDAHLLTRRAVNRLCGEINYSTNPDARVSNPAFIFRSPTTLAGLGLFIVEVSRSNSDTPRPKGLLRFSDRPST
jgi:hypothetical protein